MSGVMSKGERSPLARANSAGEMSCSSSSASTSLSPASLTTSPALGGIRSSKPVGRRSSDEMSGLAPTRAVMLMPKRLATALRVSPCRIVYQTKPGGISAPRSRRASSGTRCGKGRPSAPWPAEARRDLGAELGRATDRLDVRHLQYVAGPDDRGGQLVRVQDGFDGDAVALGDGADGVAGAHGPERVGFRSRYGG